MPATEPRPTRRSNQGIFNEVLTGILNNQLQDELFHFFHLLLVSDLHGTPGMEAPCGEMRVEVVTGDNLNPNKVLP